MGLYAERILPRLQDKIMARAPLRPIRARVCAPLAGAVLEVGFGTGLNVPYYPEGVSRISAVEPSALCMRIAAPRIARSDVPVESAGLTGERLDLPSEEFDAALSTWTLCTIPDLAGALAELHRVLKPCGTFHFVEHGRAADQKVARWQGRIEPLWKRVGGGCHLTRDIPEQISAAGFHIEGLDTYYLDGEPKPFAYIFEGRAIKC